MADGDCGGAASCSAGSPIAVSELERARLAAAPVMPAAKSDRLERDAGRNWDLFYKRNGDRFFKDRHWTRAEFADMCPDVDFDSPGVLLEAGSGCGNTLVPLLRELGRWRGVGCDLSPRAIGLLENSATEAGVRHRCTGFVCDLTVPGALAEACGEDAAKVDLATLVFVLSSVSPDKMASAVRNVRSALRRGGSVIVRDYALHDAAMLRFGRGAKIAERFYARQDGTRAYYFTTEELGSLFAAESSEWRCAHCAYVRRRTVNAKEGKDVPRAFVQARFVRL